MMAVQTPATPRRPDPSAAPSSGFLVAAVLFWIGAVVVGLLGAVVIVSFVADAGTTFDLWFLVLAVPFGLLLGAAMVTTLKAKGRRGGSLAVFLLALVAASALHGIFGLLAQQSSAQDTSAACSAEELAMLEAHSFYGDIDAPPRARHNHAIPGKAHTAGGSGAPRSSQSSPSPSGSAPGPIKAGPRDAAKPATDQSTGHRRPSPGPCCGARALLWQVRPASDRQVVMVATA